MLEIPTIKRPINEKMITVSFDESPANPQKVRAHITIDYGETDYPPDDIAKKMLHVVRAIRKQFHIGLRQFQR